jgi:hypothetical protein
MKSGELKRVVDLLDDGRWEEAHVIVDAESSGIGAWLHGIVHMLEGDAGNAAYWYRAAGRRFPGISAVKAEIAAARGEVSAMPDGD